MTDRERVFQVVNDKCVAAAALRTTRYYNSNGAEFPEGTLGVDLSELHKRLVAHIPAGGLILNAGCSAARHIGALVQAGFRVRILDASSEFACLALDYLGQAAGVRCFKGVDAPSCYKGIWACANLLHISESGLPRATSRFWASPKQCSDFYLSFKYGAGERRAGAQPLSVFCHDLVLSFSRCFLCLFGLEAFAHRLLQAGRKHREMLRDGESGQVTGQPLPVFAVPQIPKLSAAFMEGPDICLAD